MQRNLLATLVAATLLANLTGSLAPAATQALPPHAVQASGLASAVPHAADALLDLAKRIRAAPDPASALALAGAWGDLPVGAPGTSDASPDLATALARIEGKTPTAASLAALDAVTARQLVPLVDAVRHAAGLVDRAFARLTPEQRHLVLSQALRLDLAGAADEDEQERRSEAAALADQVDGQALRQGAELLLRASQDFLAARGPVSAAGAVAPLPTAGVLASPAPKATSPLVPPAPVGSGNCAPSGSSFISPGGMVEIGFGASNSYNTERVLIVDLGGDDCYDNYAASYGPGSNLALPVSLVVDVGGDDRYFTTTAHPNGPAGTAWTEGVGIGGIGLLVDRWGNDRYFASLNNEPSNCQKYNFADTWQRLYAQGVGILGVGALVDLGGDDFYSATNSNTNPDASCHWGRVYTYAQAVAARLGLGVLLDYTGNDGYSASSFASGKYDNNAHTQSQAAAAARGLALLIDEEGNDRYASNANAAMGTTLPAVHKGVFAYDFAQASLYGTNEPRDEKVTVDVCGELPPQFTACPQCSFSPCPTDPIDLKASCDDLAGGVAVPRKLPALPHPLAGVLDTIGIGSVVSPGGQATAAPPCDLQGFALLIDIMGRDAYSANSGANDSGMGCDYGAWAGTSAQGSGPAKGLAALVDAATDETDTFSATSNALAKGCLVLGVRGYTVGQGFGGSFLWDYWDRPPFDNLIVTDLSAGLLVRGGMCGRSLDFSNPFALAVNANVDDPCDQRAAGDSYYADATADNTWPSSAATSWAQTRVQGSGNGALPGKLTAAGTPAPAIPGGSFDALGLGATADFFGDDSYTATANALSTGGAAQRDDFVAAQGAGTTGFGVLVNIGDVDSYSMAASTAPAYTPATWFAMWPWMVGQADAVVPTPVSFKVCVSISCTTEDLSLSGGILVDVFGGAADSYSLAPACPNNGLLSALAPYTWGNQLTATCTNNPSPAISNGIIFGLDA